MAAASGAVLDPSIPEDPEHVKGNVLAMPVIIQNSNPGKRQIAYYS
jgi:hypothetical protein